MQRRSIILLAVPCLVLAGWLGHRALTPPGAPILVIAPPVEHPDAPGAMLHTSAESAEVFRRAFWREPAADDRILHAERREWTAESGGVRQWQWFLAVEPRSGWVDDLTSRFSLEPGTLDLAKFRTAPEWFCTALTQSSTVLRTPDESMILVQSADRRLLLATGSGGGFSLPTAAR